MLDGRDVGHGTAFAQVEDTELSIVHARAEDIVVLRQALDAPHSR